MIRLRALFAILFVGPGGCGEPPNNQPDVIAPTWTEAFDAAEVGWLLNVWGPDPAHMYAVGGTFEQGTVVHFDGQTWQPLDLGVDVPLLNWAHGFGRDNVTVVGNGGTAVHWDGTRWTVQETPTQEDLWGVWGASPDDLWAVGGRGRAPGQETILHYDGSAWTQVSVPELVRANVHAFFKVWGTSADNVYIVGQNGVVLHYDGSAWTEEFAGASDDLISLWGTGPDRIVAVGGRGNGIASVWNGSEWRTASLAPLPGLNGVWMDGSGMAYLVGIMGVTVALNVEALASTGTLEYEHTLAATNGLDFHSVHSAGNGRLVGVGGSLSFVTGPYLGIAFQADIPTKE